MIFVGASGLYGGQGHGVSPARDVSKFLLPIRADSPAFESRDELRPSMGGPVLGGCDEKGLPNIEPVAALYDANH